MAPANRCTLPVRHHDLANAGGNQLVSRKGQQILRTQAETSPLLHVAPIDPKPILGPLYEGTRGSAHPLLVSSSLRHPLRP